MPKNIQNCRILTVYASGVGDKGNYSIISQYYVHKCTQQVEISMRDIDISVPSTTNLGICPRPIGIDAHAFNKKKLILVIKLY